MQCSRCHAQMVFNYKLGFYSTHGIYCPICGNYEDAQVLLNRNPATRVQVKVGEQIPTHKTNIALRLII